MTAEAPFPITIELLRTHQVYRRAQTILSGWHRVALNEGLIPEKRWRKEHLGVLELIEAKTVPEPDWYWAMERRLTVKRLLFEFLKCTHHDDPEERMAGWHALQRAVATWDEKFANDTDVA